jgi:DNA helicase-2/ATP-dependent DNA helicase PcrA
VVGDDDQSIYAWRGADPTHILHFAETFAGATVVKLEQNYRSTRSILDAANAVIANNSKRHGKTLWSEHGAGELITHAVAPDVEVESKWVAQEIRRLRDEGKRWQDIAVLYRSNLQAKGLEDELRQHDVPYVMYGGQEFFERKEVKDVIAYLRVALNPRDELSLRRIINYPSRGIGPTTVERVVQLAAARHATMWDVVRSIANPPALIAEDDGLRPGVRVAMYDLVAVLDELGGGLRDGHGVVASARRLIERISLFDDLREAAPSATAAQRRIDNVEGLMNSLTRFEARSPGVDALGDYLRRLSLESGEEADTSGDKVVMTTLHGAKGLEFPVVFMVGLEEELLPHARTLNPQATDVLDADHASDVSEERRLCYGGITRAQRKRYITRACQRVSRGRPMPRTPSRFLLEIPDELLEVRDLAEEARQKVPTDEVRSFFANFAGLED